jgi:cytochrome-b5 reductase
LLIKKYPGGPVSSYVHSLKPGDYLEVKGPNTTIPYKANSKKQIGMIAGGTGITPMLQIVHEILKNPNDKTEISLVFANIAHEDILLKERLDKLAKQHKNFKVYYVLEKPPSGWNQGVGYVTEEVLKKTMPKASKDSLIMVCCIFCVY